MTTRLTRAAIVAAIAGSLLAGCAGAPAYEPETAELLQQHVLAVSTSTAEGDWPGASTRLMELEASAATALARGEITQERYDAIMSALALVRADVDAAIAAEEAAAAEAAAQAEAERQAAEEAARQAEEEDRKGPGNGGKKDDEKDDD